MQSSAKSKDDKPTVSAPVMTMKPKDDSHKIRFSQTKPAEKKSAVTHRKPPTKRNISTKVVSNPSFVEDLIEDDKDDKEQA